MKKRYSWKRGARFRADPQVIGQEIDSLGDRTAEGIVLAASEEDSALHPLFNWDDQEAAHQNRLDTATKITRNLVIQVLVEVAESKEPVSIEVRAFEFVTKNPGDRCKTAVPVETALANDNWRHEVLSRIRQDLEAARRELKEYSYLNPAIPKASRLIERAGKELEKVGKR